jgi:hypothetical protein
MEASPTDKIIVIFNGVGGAPLLKNNKVRVPCEKFAPSSPSPLPTRSAASFPPHNPPNPCVYVFPLYTAVPLPVNRSRSLVTAASAKSWTIFGDRYDQ